MVSTNLVVPVVLWGPTPPTHCVSSVFMSDDQTTLVTGCYDGQICIWNVDPGTLKMSPRCMLVGHSAPVICLVRASLLQENNFIVSSSENGEMCTWDLVDGKCTEAVKLPQIHTQIQSYQPANSEDLRLFCIGYYPEIVVMDPFSLEIIYMLSSKVKPDWISALHVLRPMRRKDDVVLAITTTGTVKVWTLVGNENKNAEPIYENESKEIRCLNAITMNCCVQNQRTVLIVCTKYWQIFDAGDFTVLCSVIAPSRERWQGGDFISSDRVLLWTDEGKGYLYKLPANCIPDNKEFHSKSMVRDAPYLYYVLQQPGDKILSCPPAMQLVRCQQNLKQSYLLRGDSEGYNSIWTVPDVPLDNISILQAKQMSPRFLKPTICTSLLEAWSMMDPPPVGILDQLSRITDSPVKLTSSIYLPQQSRLVIGREDGTIVIVPATQTVMMQLLAGIQQNFTEWPSHQILYGHRGRVNCLLCPSLMHARYDKSLLLSGGVDFAVCVWDLYSGSLLHRFCVHAGEITQLLVPPETCSPRILKCICSVASDHSVTLLSVQERKCVTLASRHLFPVVTIKWRPLDDFLIVGCSDGSVYVWQMETGHLDRVLHGMLAEEVLMACDEQSSDSLTNGNSTTAADIGSEMGMANPAVHFFRGLKSRNMNAIRHATQRGLHQLQQLHGHNQGNLDFLMKHRNNPLLIQGLRTNPKDAECHILFFDIEGLIFELHSEEYAQMTPEALEALGIMISNPKDKTTTLDASKKISDFFGKVKNKAGDMEKILKDKDRHGLVQKFKEKTEIMEKKVQAKVDSLQKAVDTPERKSDMKSKIDSKMEVTHVMEVAQLLLSLLHSWGLDPHLDKVCESQLGLLRPLVPISFGVLSKAGYMSLLLPTWQNNCTIPDDIEANSSNALKKRDFPPEILRQEQLTKMFTSRLHWELSPTLTSNHILALVAMSNTLMSMSSASFLTESEKTKKLMRLAQRSESTLNSEDEREELIAHHTSQIKQGWSLLSTHHCFLLPDKIEALEPRKFKRPQVEMMAKRWQHHCIEVREAAQQILLGELSRMGKKGRKQLVEHWAQYLPLYTHTEPIATQQVQHTMAANTTNNSSSQNNNSNNNGNHGSGNGNLNVANVVGGANTNSTTSSSIASGINQENQDDDFDEEEEGFIRKPSSLSELKRKQTTAVILLGVIGAEFGQDISAQESPCTRISLTERRRSSGVEGFGIANNLARLTSMALAHLLYAPSSAKLPQFTPLRRAAIDLLGRGFTVWEPYLDVSKVLLGLLEISCEGKNVPNLNYKLPLTPQADACRTARHALRLIATARPAAFITTMAREVARYNTMQQNAQSVNVTVTQSVLFKAKSEILQCVEMLIDKMQAEIAGLLVEVMDITLHCLDSNELKNHSMAEVFPPMCKFNQISHCAQTRRIAVGASNGHLAIYELRQNKCQMIPAHSHPISSLAFSPDGKYLVSYSCKENRLSFWQTSTGMFGLGQSQTRCTKGYSTAPIPDVSRFNPMRLAKLVWINNRTVTLMLADGSETRFNV